jgi:tRNA (adenine37-N6)-methyltransferase
VIREKKIRFVPIGVIRSEHKLAEKTPIQPVYAGGCRGRAEIYPEYEAGLQDLEGFSHIYLLYELHRAGQARMLVKPFLQDKEHGVFATRSPNRPNALGLSVVRLLRRKGRVLFLEGLDMLDGTPLIDIKPYTDKFDRIKTDKNGWQDEVNVRDAGRKGKRGYKPAGRK